MSWTPPTTNVDGSPLVDLASYRIAWGCSVSGIYPNSTTIQAPASSYLVENLPDAGTCYFVATALNSRGQESARSNQASKVMGTLAVPGNPATGPFITWREEPAVAIAKAFALQFGDSSSETSETSSTFDSTGYTHLVVGVKHEGAATTITVSDNKSSTTVITGTKESHTNGDLHQQMFVLAIGSPGTGHTVTVALSGARPWRGFGVWLVDADGGTVELDAEAVAEGGTSAVDAGTLSTSGASVVSFLFIGPYNSGAFTPSAGWTEDFDGSVGSVSTAGMSRGPETTTPINPAATWNQESDWAAGSLSLREPTSTEDMVAAGSLSITGSADLDAAGAVAAAGSLSITGAADLDATGTLVAAGTVAIAGVADLDALGALAAAGLLAVTGAADLDAPGNMAAAGAVSISGVAALSGLQNDLSASGSLAISGSADLDASGTIQAAGSLAIAGAAELTDADNPDIAAAGVLSIGGIADLDAPGTLATVGALAVSGAADLRSSDVLVASGTLEIHGSADIDAPGRLTAAGQIVILGAAFLSDANAGSPNARRARSKIRTAGTTQLKAQAKRRDFRLS